MIDNQQNLPNQSSPTIIPVQASTNSPPNVPYKEVKSKSKILLIIFGFFIFALLILSVMFNLYQYQKLASLNQIISKSNSLPLDPTKDFIKTFGTSYYFEANIKDIRKMDSKVQIIPDINDFQLPQLLVDPNTVIYLENSGKFKEVGTNELKAGQKIGLLLMYSRFNKWSVVRATILP